MYYYQRLKDIREDNEKTQSDIAEVLNTVRQQYNRWETGKQELPMHHFITLARYYNISLDYLLGLIREPLPYERSDHAVQCPQDFTAEDIQKVREYIKFLEFQKKAKQ